MKVSIERLLRKLRGKRKQAVEKNIPGVGQRDIPPATAVDDSAVFKARVAQELREVARLRAQRQDPVMNRFLEHQHKIDQLQYQMQVEVAKAEQKAKINQAKQEAEAYKKIMGHPGINDLVTDIYGSVYEITGVHEHRGFVSPELRIQGAQTAGMNVAHVRLQWVNGKVDLGIRFGDADLWPDPNQPVMYCFVDNEDVVYAGTPEHGSIFSSSRPRGSKNNVLWKKVQSWPNESNNVYALLEYSKTLEGIDQRTGYVIPRELTPEEKEKFDVFTGTLKLRAEIIEEAKSANHLR